VRYKVKRIRKSGEEMFIFIDVKKGLRWPGLTRDAHLPYLPHLTHALLFDHDGAQDRERKSAGR